MLCVVYCLTFEINGRLVTSLRSGSVVAGLDVTRLVETAQSNLLLVPECTLSGSLDVTMLRST
jgi:hypothetical protein